jgi:diguanylate cyclase (GGDEF)-like protein
LQLRQQALHDPLTGLGNRRFMDEQVRPLYEQIHDAGKSMTCLMVDLDNFKKINDKLGHPMGDKILLLLASLLRASIRADDIALRLGGDEFVLWLADITTKRAHDLAESLSKLFDQQIRAMPLDGLVTGLSIGLATTGRDRPDTADDLLAIADQHLCQAKRCGKRRIIDSTAA